MNRDNEDDRRHILLVEDYPPNAVTTMMFLEQIGYSVDVAANGREALEKFSTGNYSVIIMDIQLPDMDGIEITRRIRALESENAVRRPVPIIATTGNATEDDTFLCLKAGANDCMTKPFHLPDLQSKLESFIVKPR